MIVPRIALLMATLLAPCAVASDTIASASKCADAALAAIIAALAPATAADPLRSSLGHPLARYADNPGVDPARHESTAEAARRILAGTPPAQRAIDDLIAELDATAAAIQAAVRMADARTPDATLDDLRAKALLARFHARRAIAAVHYNLFKRGLRLAELVAATYAEKDAVAVWRELCLAAAPPAIAAARRAELPKLEASLRDLEEQCCPPDEAIMREKVWQPVGKHCPLRPSLGACKKNARKTFRAFLKKRC
jgi:hypothetical protein